MHALRNARGRYLLPHDLVVNCCKLSMITSFVSFWGNSMKQHLLNEANTKFNLFPKQSLLNKMTENIEAFFIWCQNIIFNFRGCYLARCYVYKFFFTICKWILQRLKRIHCILNGFILLLSGLMKVFFLIATLCFFSHFSAASRDFCTLVER